MAVRIRLTRVGATKRPAYRVIAIDKRRSRDGRALEILGFYDPLTEPATVQLDTEKINAWIGKGAQPSDTVVKLMAQAERAAAAGGEPETPKPAARRTKKPAKKATAEPGAEAAEPAAEAAPTAAEAAPQDAAPTADASSAEDAPQPAPDEAASGQAEKAEA